MEPAKISKNNRKVLDLTVIRGKEISRITKSRDNRYRSIINLISRVMLQGNIHKESSLMTPWDDEYIEYADDPMKIRGSPDLSHPLDNSYHRTRLLL